MLLLLSNSELSLHLRLYMPVRYVCSVLKSSESFHHLIIRSTACAFANNFQNDWKLKALFFRLQVSILGCDTKFFFNISNFIVRVKVLV